MIQSIEDGRKEDGNRSIADKILKRLHDLDKTVGNNQGRWAWELLQNAKDSIADDDDRTVSVQIVLNENSVEFKHNGTHFTEQDVRGLINQISSKEVEERQEAKKTGRFGTGFLTTHLLSRIIHVKGILETSSNDFYKFEFPLDRQGKVTAQLIPKIENAWSEFHKSTRKIRSNYDKDLFNTSFLYQLETLEQQRVAKIGIVEFTKLVPFVLSFIPKIQRVEIFDNITGNNIVFTNSMDLINDFILPISKIENDVATTMLILLASSEKVTIATGIEETSIGYSVRSLKDLPKLFCDFPLIGTENFHFPVVINSFFFNPTTERDGIWLNGDDDQEVLENQELLVNAVELYEKLILHLEESNYCDLYNIAETRMPCVNETYFDDEWYKDEIQRRIREVIFNAKIVENDSDPIIKKAIKDLAFPLKSYTEKERDKIWQFFSDLYPDAVCKRSHLHKWCEISWESWHKLNYHVLVNELVKQANIANLMSVLDKNEKCAIDWLNSLCNFILEDEGNLALFENNAIIPNRNGTFLKRTDIRIDKIADEELIYILELLGDDWKNSLIHNGINFGRYQFKEKKDIASKITESLKNPRYKDDDFVKAISLLSEWFDNNTKEGEELFSELYRNRAELFMNTITDKENLYKVMRSRTELSKLAEIAKSIEDNPGFLGNLQMAGELINLLQEFNVSDVAELKSMLRLAQNTSSIISKIQITQETLVSLGVTSLEELEKALQDKDLAAQFIHTSNPSLEMFKYVQSLIARAKTNVIRYLETLPDYDCTDMEELATTVIGGIKKDGLSIHVVVRPSDNGEVIVYYSSEKDTLDYANAELWIDNGRDEPRHLTLGKILKTTGINRIPV